MNTLGQAVDDYLELSRGLGFKLVNYGAYLREFVSFLEQKKTSHITTALAVQFAILHTHHEPKEKAARYSAVRGFASYRVGADPATEIPPIGLIRGRSRRARPYLYSDQEVRQLLEAARHLPSTYSLRPWTYYCFFGLPREGSSAVRKPSREALVQARRRSTPNGVESIRHVLRNRAEGSVPCLK
jgi:integrase/recombinase XerD